MKHGNYKMRKARKRDVRRKRRITGGPPAGFARLPVLDFSPQTDRPNVLVAAAQAFGLGSLMSMMARRGKR